MQAGAAALACKRTTLSQQIDAKNECEPELGEGRVRAD